MESSEWYATEVRVVEEKRGRVRDIECGDGWVEVRVESSKWYATERRTCDRQEKQNKTNNEG